jgi:hypothetical protein
MRIPIALGACAADAVLTLPAFQASAVTFPTEGCWNVTGRAGEASLTFVTLVLKSIG